MQMIITLLLVCFTAFSLAGEESSNLLPEWQKPVIVKGNVLLPHWRFGDWGRRGPKGSPSGRRNSIAAVDGKVQVLLENPGTPQAVNMFFRTLKISLKSPRIYRLKAVMVNSGTTEALVKMQMNSSGRRNHSERAFFTVSGKAAEREIALTVPANSRSLQISLTLTGPGKVTFSDLRLTAEEPPPIPFLPLLPEKPFPLPEKTPVELSVRFPLGFQLGAGESVRVSLPWGVRLISCSRYAVVDKVSLQVKEKTTYLLKSAHKRYRVSHINLLLGSDLPVSDNPLNGAVRLERKGQIGDWHYFSLRTVKDVPAAPPRFFRLVLPVSSFIAPHENALAVEGSLLRSGANVLLSSGLNIPLRQLRTAKIRQRAYLHLPAIRAEQHCYYSMIRNETFWDKHFLPSLRRSILRHGNRHLEAFFCDSALGQTRAVNCLCALCRSELGEFAPRLPRRAVKYNSPGLLAARYPADLNNFRTARLAALWEGARLHLPVDSRGFARRPRLIPCYSLQQVFSGKGIMGTPEAVIVFNSGLPLPDGEINDPAVNFAAASALCKMFRSKQRSRTALTVKYTPPGGGLSQKALMFELLNLYFSGFTGVWIDLSAAADYSQRAAVAQTALILREYENFFRQREVRNGFWHLKDGAPLIKLPPVPAPTGYQAPLPRSMKSVILKFWQRGGKGVLAIGNFSSEVRRCVVGSSLIPLKARVRFSARSISGAEIRLRGAELLLPPRSWTFAEVENL